MSMFRSSGIRNVSIAKQIAHTAILPLGNKDFKLLQDLITAEKAIFTSLTRLADDFGKATEALKLWGQGEGEDLGDVLTKCSAILAPVSSSVNQLANHEAAIRVHMKAVRTREESLDVVKKHRRSVGAKADSAEKKLSKMGPGHKHAPQQSAELNKLRDEMRQLDSNIMVEEAQLGDFKRQTTKDWMALKFGGLLELAQRVVIIGNTGKQMIEEIPLEVTTPGYGRAPYGGHARTEGLLFDATSALAQVFFQPTTGNLAYHYESTGGQNQPYPDQQQQQQQPQHSLSHSPSLRHGTPSFRDSAAHAWQQQQQQPQQGVYTTGGWGPPMQQQQQQQAYQSHPAPSGLSPHAVPQTLDRSYSYYAPSIASSTGTPNPNPTASEFGQYTNPTPAPALASRPTSTFSSQGPLPQQRTTSPGPPMSLGYGYTHTGTPWTSGAWTTDDASRKFGTFPATGHGPQGSENNTFYDPQYGDKGGGGGGGGDPIAPSPPPPPSAGPPTIVTPGANPWMEPGAHRALAMEQLQQQQSPAPAPPAYEPR